MNYPLSQQFDDFYHFLEKIKINDFLDDDQFFEFYHDQNSTFNIYQEKDFESFVMKLNKKF